MPWGPCGREERRRRGGGVCKPGVRWERGAWAAGRDSGRDTTLSCINRPLQTIWTLHSHSFDYLVQHNKLVGSRSHFTAQTLLLPRNCRTLVRVLLWAALVLGRRVPWPSDTLNMSKPNTHILWISAVSHRPHDASCEILTENFNTAKAPPQGVRAALKSSKSPAYDLGRTFYGNAQLQSSEPSTEMFTGWLTYWKKKISPHMQTQVHACMHTHTHTYSKHNYKTIWRYYESRLWRLGPCWREGACLYGSSECSGVDGQITRDTWSTRTRKRCFQVWLYLRSTLTFTQWWKKRAKRGRRWEHCHSC